MLDRVRSIIARNIEKGLLPNYTLDLIHLKSQYNTIGITGLWEAIKHLNGTYVDTLGNANYTPSGLEFATEILAAIHEAKDLFIITQICQSYNVVFPPNHIERESSLSPKK